MARDGMGRLGNRRGTGSEMEMARDGMARDGTAQQWTAAMDLVMDGSDRSDGLSVARWDGLGNGWLGDGLDGSTDRTGSAIDGSRWIGWLVMEWDGSAIGYGRLAMDWMAREDGTGSAMDGSASHDGWQWTARRSVGRARKWMARRRAMDGNGRLAGRLGNQQWTARDVLDGSQWDELGNGRLGVARWIGRLVMGRLGNGGLGVAQWIGRLVMGWARQWTAWRCAMDRTACDGMGSAMDGSASCDEYELDGLRWIGRLDGLGNGWLGVP